jgi:hypothetical protein
MLCAGGESVRNIGLIGLAGSGKDTAAEALYKLGYKRVSFAQKLKYLAGYFGWDGFKDARGRALLQDLGMAARRYNPNHWIEELHSICGRKRFLVYTDVRFQNEADYVREQGGIVVRIVRPGQQGGIVVRIVRPGQIAENHESELKQSEVAADMEIVNDGSIEDLHNKIRAILTK